MATEILENVKAKVANFNPERKEGAVAKAIEEQTSKLPSDLFLWTAVGAMAASLTLKNYEERPSGIVCRTVGCSLPVNGALQQTCKTRRTRSGI